MFLLIRTKRELRLVDTHPELNRASFIEDITEYIDSSENSSVEVSLGGILVLYNNMLNSHLILIKSLSIVLLGIFLMLLVLLGHLKLQLLQFYLIL